MVQRRVVGSVMVGFGVLFRLWSAANAEISSWIGSLPPVQANPMQRCLEP